MCKNATPLDGLNDLTEFIVMRVCAEGVLYAKKDYNLAKHPQVDASNLEVIKLMQSFKSKEYIKETFSWQ